jgi:hypothetical protein
MNEIEEGAVMKRILQLIVLFLSIAGAAGLVFGEPWEKYDQPVPTRITVRILAHGAKAMYPRFGARVVIRNAETNEILVQGEVEGTSGDTAALMKAGYHRTSGRYGLTRNDEGVAAVINKGEETENVLFLTPENLKKKGVEVIPYSPKDDGAKFTGTLMVSKPTVLRIEAIGPLKYSQATMTDSITTLLLPGRHIEGQGIVLNLRGLVLDIAAPKEKETVRTAGNREVPVSFTMNMMCGCPIFEDPGNPWQPGMFTFYVEAYYDGKLYYDKEIHAQEVITGRSTFNIPLPLPEKIHEEKSMIKLRIMGAQPDLANYGMDEVMFRVE